MRLNRYLAKSGLGSRRKVEELIEAGQVSINGKAVTDLATQVDAETDEVVVDGRRVRPPLQHVYLMLNKPKGYDVTRGGRHHHRRAYDLLPEGTHPSVQAVGRLDRNSTGLLLFTNDGELANRLAHPSHGCRKEYIVEVEGKPSSEAVRKLREGVELEDGPAKAIEAKILEDEPTRPPRLRIVMGEGRKRIVRRMCEAVGHPVTNLERMATGPVRLGDLRRGKVRPLRRGEIVALRKSVGLEVEENHSPHQAKGRGASSRQHQPRFRSNQSGAKRSAGGSRPGKKPRPKKW